MIVAVLKKDEAVKADLIDKARKVVAPYLFEENRRDGSGWQMVDYELGKLNCPLCPVQIMLQYRKNSYFDWMMENYLRHMEHQHSAVTYLEYQDDSNCEGNITQLASEQGLDCSNNATNNVFNDAENGIVDSVSSTLGIDEVEDSLANNDAIENDADNEKSDGQNNVAVAENDIVDALKDIVEDDAIPNGNCYIIVPNYDDAHAFSDIQTPVTIGESMPIVELENGLDSSNNATNNAVNDAENGIVDSVSSTLGIDELEESLANNDAIENDADNEKSDGQNNVAVAENDIVDALKDIVEDDAIPNGNCYIIVPNYDDAHPSGDLVRPKTNSRRSKKKLTSISKGECKKHPVKWKQYV